MQRHDRAVDLRSCHIAIDARYLKRKGIGISRYVHMAVCDFLDARAHVTLLTDDADHRAALVSEYPDAAALSLPGRSGFLWEQRTLPRHLALADYDYFIAPANYGLPLAYRGRTALILVVHDLIPLRLPHLYLLPRPLWAGKYLISVVFSAIRADHIIADSNATGRDIARILRRSVDAVAYPLDREVDRGNNSGAERLSLDIWKSIAGDAPVKDYFVYNGGADPRKNVPMLLHAFARLRREMTSFDLVILGARYEHFNPIIHKLGLSDCVHIAGYVDDATRDAILAGAAALVYPSRMEGFGLPIIEAFAAGIPVVTGTGGSLQEIGGSAVTYAQPLNEISLATAMAAVTDEAVRRCARSVGDAQLKLLRMRPEAKTLAAAVASIDDSHHRSPEVAKPKANVRFRRLIHKGVS